MHGSFVNSLQWLLNKVATAAALLVIAHFLDPDAYGVAGQALAIASFLVVLSPLTMGDVLIAHPTRFAALVPTARRLTLMIGVAMSVVILVSIPLMIWIYGKYPAAWLGGLLAVLALRPILEATLVVPVSRLRLALEYRRIAVIDGVVQFGVTLVSVVTAVFGGKATALVVPQVAGAGVRSLWYRRTRVDPETGGYRKRLAGLLMRGFMPAAAAQYLHNVIVMMEVLVLGFLSGDYQTGLFAFAFTIAAQANSVIAFQLGLVLQPIFGRLQDDPARQVSGFMRAQRVLGAVCVPISLAQAMLAEPLFRVAFNEKWQPAVVVFQIISLAQAFYFATGPTMSCLRAQRRFGLFLKWQGVQFLVSAPVYWLGATLGARDDLGLAAAGTALASGVVWAISAPIGVWMCIQAAGPRSFGSALMIFVRPWLLAGPIFVGGYFASQWLGGYGLWGDIASLAVVGPLSLVLSLWVARISDPEVRELSNTVFRAIGKRFLGSRG